MLGCLFLNPLSEKAENISIGRGKMIVEFFSADIELRVWNTQVWKFKAKNMSNQGEYKVGRN